MTKKEEREARKLEKLRLEKERMYEMFFFEREYGDHQAICGIDEGKRTISRTCCCGCSDFAKRL